MRNSEPGSPLSHLCFYVYLSLSVACTTGDDVTASRQSPFSTKHARNCQIRFSLLSLLLYALQLFAFSPIPFLSLLLPLLHPLSLSIALYLYPLYFLSLLKPFVHHYLLLSLFTDVLYITKHHIFAVPANGFPPPALLY